MHFWIDKRSQACGFSGRHRVPASLSAAGCGQQHRRQRRRSRAKPMVTPVHRFQPIECVAGGMVGGGGNAGGGGLRSQHGARRSLYHRQQFQRHHHGPLHNCFPSAYSGMHSAGAHAMELDSSVFLDLPLDGSGDHNDTHSDNQLGSQAMTHLCMKCAAWMFVILVVLSVAAAKFYIDQQEGHSWDIVIFFTLMAAFLLLFCIFSIYRSKETRDRVAAAVSSSSQAPQSTASNQGQAQVHEIETATSEDTGLGQITDQATSIILAPTSGPPQVSELPPPPYHIAILMPQQTQNSGRVQADDESPPPSYDKAVS